MSLAEVTGHASGMRIFSLILFSCYIIIMTSLGTPYGILVWTIIINVSNKLTKRKTSKLLS